MANEKKRLTCADCTICVCVGGGGLVSYYVVDVKDSKLSTGMVYSPSLLHQKHRIGFHVIAACYIAKYRYGFSTNTNFVLFTKKNLLVADNTKM